MEQSATVDITTIIGRETWTAEEYKELMKLLAAGLQRKNLEAFREFEKANADAKGTAAMKVGVIRLLFGRCGRALEALAEATDNKDRRYIQALCYKLLGQYDKAIEEFERAKAKGFDAHEADLHKAECLAFSGNTQEALAIADKADGEDAHVLYVRGLAEELAGNSEKAFELYTQSAATDPAFGPALFRMAYYCDLHGLEEDAIKFYKDCLAHPPVFANALLNLAVLYEDMGRYDQAVRCLERLLAVNPNHARARLFLKDAQASRTMFYDEDQAKRVARRNAVLDIPVTDFELSVRARNCLKKMNIRSLGDLARISESELLGYKNFGETSLKEIKDMLVVKGLRLGQAIEEGVAQPYGTEIPLIKGANEGALAIPVEQLVLSIRARKALESLKVTTLGQLATKTEAELLACKNFGQTSLNEIRQRLAENGLRLRETI
jgi:DNA-directed RNA polymerase subunit alpha